MQKFLEQIGAESKEAWGLLVQDQVKYLHYSCITNLFWGTTFLVVGIFLFKALKKIWNNTQISWFMLINIWVAKHYTIGLKIPIKEK